MAAILDVNLAGEPIYPLAELLAERNLPFVFVTGYGAESIDARFRNVPILQKPIEHDILKSVFIVGDGSTVGDRHGVPGDQVHS